MCECECVRGREGERERERDLFSVHNCSRMQVDVHTVLVSTNFKTIHLHSKLYRQVEYSSIHVRFSFHSQWVIPNVKYLNSKTLVNGPSRKIQLLEKLQLHSMPYV